MAADEDDFVVVVAVDFLSCGDEDNWRLWGDNDSVDDSACAIAAAIAAVFSEDKLLAFPLLPLLLALFLVVAADVPPAAEEEEEDNEG